MGKQYKLRYFRVGPRELPFLVRCSDPRKPVFHSRPQYSFLERQLRDFVQCILPAALALYIRHWLRWLFLPDEVYIKQEREGHEAEFETERQFYLKHTSWHGTIAPMYYGAALSSSTRKRSLILGVARGQCIDTIPTGQHADAFRMVEATLDCISAAGVVHADLETRHIFISDGGAIFIDWGLMSERSRDEATMVNTLDYEEMRGYVR